MSKQPYLTAPVPTTGMPSGLPFIIGNEAAERFSFYGMRTILVTFMTKYLLDSNGTLALMSEDDAKGYYHLFMMAAYFFPLMGAFAADVWLGKYRTIMSLSVVYCLGHLALAIDDTRIGLFAGLLLVAIGTGGIKPCVSAHLGDQFGQSNVHLQSAAFGWFYLSINFGSFISTGLTPWLLERFPQWIKATFYASAEDPTLIESAPSWIDRIGPHVAFGTPGLLMLIATILFWLGRYRFVHIPARGWPQVRTLLNGEGGRALMGLIPIYVFIAVFWSLYDQSGGAWVLQARAMDRKVFGYELLESQIQVINPLLILIYVPLFTYVIYPAIHRVFPLTPLRKISIGLFTTAVAFAISAYAQELVDAHQKQLAEIEQSAPVDEPSVDALNEDYDRAAREMIPPGPSILWQLAAYLVMTAAEVMVSVTGLEFSYTQAPRELKSIVMAFYLLAVSAGNLFTALVNFLNGTRPGGGKWLAGAGYYWFFTGLMALAACVFIAVAQKYRGRVYIQEEEPHPDSPA